MTPGNTPSLLVCPNCGYSNELSGLHFCPNCGKSLPAVDVRSTQINVDQTVGQVQDGEVIGVKIGQVIGNVFVGRDEEAQARQRQNLRTLLDKVKHFWLEGVLDPAVREATLIELEKRVEPGAVARPLPTGAGVTPPASPNLPPEISIADVFDATDQGLLIMDGSGSGKTTTLLALARDAVTRAEQDPTAPVPVVLNLSSWSQAKDPIADWVVKEMNWGYLIPQEMSRRWLGEGNLALLLDGLDEVGPEHIGDCIAALNRFREDHGLLHIAICTRTEDYRAAAALLRLSGAVKLLPLTDDQIEAYLAAAGSRAATLAALLQQDADLRDAARTPLMLSLMPQAYADVSLEDLEGEHFNTPQKRREYLLDRYVDYLATPAGAGPSTPFTREQTLSDLGWLARGMTAQRQSIFLVEQLQPGWLATRGRRWAYWVGSRALMGLLIGLVHAATIHVVGTPLDRVVYVITALLAGALIGIVDGVGAGMARTLARWPLWALQASSALTAALLAGACFYLAFGPGLGRPGPVPGLLAAGAALVFGLLFGLGGVRTGDAGDVRPVEALSWSWRAARRGLLPALLMLLAAAGVITAILAASGRLVAWPTLGPGYSLLAGLAVVIIYGLRGRTVEHRSYPNQGTWLSARNAAQAGLLLGVACGLVYGIVYTVALRTGALAGPVEALRTGALVDPMEALRIGVLRGLAMALRIGVLFALWYGLFDVIKHLTLRGLLATISGPRWNLVQFLEHAARLGFLQKVGGGYMFPNRLLQEHFAGMESNRDEHAT